MGLSLSLGYRARKGRPINIGPLSDTTVPSIPDSSLTISNVTGSSFDVSFNKAIDNESPQSALVYYLYTSSELGSLDGPPSFIKQNGTLRSQGTDVSILSASGFNEGDDLEVNIIVVDEEGNERSYTSSFVTIQDITAPTVGTPTLTASNVQDTSFIVNFSKASDNVDDEEALRYSLYTSTTNNLTTDPATVEANGTFQGEEINVTSIDATGLNAETLYYYNVIVTDTSGNKSIYTSNSKTTSAIPVDDVAPVLSSSNLTTSSVTSSGFLVDFEKATDSVTPQTELIYKLYTSANDDLTTDPVTVESNGTLQSQGTDVSTLPVSGLSQGQSVYFNIIVEDEVGNKTIYSQETETTLDVNPPSVSNKELTTSNINTTGFDVGFSKATDNVDSQDVLTYYLYTSLSNNLTTDAATVEANGTLQSQGTDVASLSASNLSVGSLYYFNIVVEDSSGNKTIYTINSQQTNSLSFALYSSNFNLEIVDI